MKTGAAILEQTPPNIKALQETIIRTISK